MTQAAVETMRLFFAAWPEPNVQHALHELGQRVQRESGGKVVAAGNLHLTFAFLGDVERYRLPQIEAAAGRVSGTSCELIVNRVGYWRHNRILWAGLEHSPDALRQVVGNLSSELRDIGFQPDERPYVAHVTLLRNARRGPGQSMFRGISWPVHDLALIASVPVEGKRAYKVLRRWPLTNV